MKIEKLAAIGEIVSSVAIVITLAYLAVQTQQNTAAIVSSSRQQTLDAELAVITKMIDYPRIQVDYPIDYEELTTEEKYQQEMMLNGFFRIREHLWLQYQSGLIDEETWNSYHSLFEYLFTIDSVRSYWERTPEGTFDLGFSRELNVIYEKGSMP